MSFGVGYYDLLTRTPEHTKTKSALHFCNPMHDHIKEHAEKELLHEPITHTKVELARQLFVSLETQVQLADRKVQVIFGLNAFLVAALSLQNQQSIMTLGQSALTLSVIFDIVLKVCLLSCVCLATWAAIQALQPRVRAPKGVEFPQLSLFFFKDIRSQTMSEFTDAFINLTNRDAVIELLSSAYSISGILTLKYTMLRRSTLLLSVALLIWILLQVNKFLS